MNAVKGTYRLLYEDMRWWLLLFSAITLGLAVIFIAIGVIFEVSFTATLFGPIYGAICTIAAIGIVYSFPVLIGLGSTRKQFLKSYYFIASIMVICFITVLNIIYFFMNTLNQLGVHKLSFFHPGMLYSINYHILAYVWIDLMVGFSLLGLSAFLTVSWRRLGNRNFLIIFFAFNLLATILINIVNITSLLEWIFELNVIYTFTIVGFIGFCLLICTFPMMKHAPLVMKARNA
ncbi:hypothetical protein [Cytobacillus sp. IB215665]|uniref:hypothetical protein n=1 Tax=Cytobacillus sp. IB215665 TaxID=3097357 RepID=UPI002A0B68A4|nr:hypothetical protein [Cytobacillus sp. IB215665]MDX8366350.1 hypothetical protein [Cytobacillus sp. IB215665]